MLILLRSRSDHEAIALSATRSAYSCSSDSYSWNDIGTSFSPNFKTKKRSLPCPAVINPDWFETFIGASETWYFQESLQVFQFEHHCESWILWLLLQFVNRYKPCIFTVNFHIQAILHLRNCIQYESKPYGTSSVGLICSGRRNQRVKEGSLKNS